VAELVRELKAILRPVSVLSRQANRNTATLRALEIGLRMIGPMVGIYDVELSSGAAAPKF